MQAKNGMRLLQEYNGDIGWTELMDRVVVACQKDDGKSVADFRKAAESVPSSPEMLDLLNFSKSLGPVHIVSDANDLYINSWLNYNCLHVDGVHTNPTVFDGNLLRITPYSKSPHGCQRCPKNICKTFILRNFILATLPERPKIFYFGDGSNDFCPVLNILTENDMVFVRDDPDDPRARGLIKKIGENASSIHPEVFRWAKGKDLFDLVKRIIG